MQIDNTVSCTCPKTTSTGWNNIYSKEWLKAHFGLSGVKLYYGPLDPFTLHKKNPKHPLTFAVVTRFSRMWWKCYIWVDTQFFAPFPARFHTQVEIKHVGEWILVDWMQRLDAVSWSMSSAAFCCSLCSGVFVTLTVTHHEQRCRLVYWQREGSQSPIFFRGLTHLKKQPAYTKSF